MVRAQILARGITDESVLRAMRTVPRDRFVPSDSSRSAYEDRPLPLPFGQTISQPYMVALMTERLEVGPGKRVLEIGTGSGYQTAILAALGCEVFSVEILPDLAQDATSKLESWLRDEQKHRATNDPPLGRVETRTGDGYHGWPEAGPYDGILLTAAPPEIPEPLRVQLAPGGRVVAPVGTDRQELQVIEQEAGGFKRHSEIPVRFVPMTGQAQTPHVRRA